MSGIAAIHGSAIRLATDAARLARCVSLIPSFRSARPHLRDARDFIDLNNDAVRDTRTLRNRRHNFRSRMIGATDFRDVLSRDQRGAFLFDQQLVANLQRAAAPYVNRDRSGDFDRGALEEFGRAQSHPFPVNRFRV
jgi:hypothetical protein